MTTLIGGGAPQTNPPPVGKPTKPTIYTIESRKAAHNTYDIRWWLTRDGFTNEELERVALSECTLECGNGIQLTAYTTGNYVFVDPGSKDSRHPHRHSWHTGMFGNRVTKVAPFAKIQVVSTAWTRNVEVPSHQRPYHGAKEHLDFYGTDKGKPLPWLFVKVRVEVEGADPVETVVHCKIPTQGAARLDSDESSPKVFIDTEFYGYSHQWVSSLFVEEYEWQERGYNGSSHTYHNTINGLHTLYKHLKWSAVAEGKDAWWQRFLAVNKAFVGDDKGFKKAAKAHAEVLDKLASDHPLEHAFLHWLKDGRTRNKTSNNALLSAFLDTTAPEGADRVAEVLRETRNEVFLTIKEPRSTLWHWNRHHTGTEAVAVVLEEWLDPKRELCLSLPGAGDKKREQEAKADWTKRKDLAGQADGLGISETEFPLLRQAVIDGKIPTGVFFQPGPKDKREPVNVEFPLWERALAREGWAEVLYEISRDAASRSTYERDITPYINFMFKIEKYLDRHAPGETGWKAMPKYVQSQWELEMDDDAGENGTVKRRSAFTPVADNDARTITVPYVAVCVTGVRTQWCYARYFHVFEEGMTDPISGGIVLRDLEPALNGRDDYGLCFYTLNGTSTAQGYPTFLIIFEKRHGGRHVHFHRVRPCRSAGGITTPASKLIEACYQYMAGNIPASEVTAQQGDLVFLQANDPVAAKAKVDDPRPVNEFESHRFVPLAGEPVKLYESKAKEPKNRLGFIHAPEGMAVRHPEHDDIERLEPGWYEIRRCKSWEANPKAIWSLTID